MKLLLTGLSHKTAPVHLREKLALPESELPEALHELQNLGASEAMILSTCNRVEIALTSPDHQEPSIIAERFFEAWQGSTTPFEDHLYRLEASDAIRHLFRVAASLDSMVVGEPQVLGQLKTAYAIAKTEGAVGGLLEQVLTRVHLAWPNESVLRPVLVEMAVQLGQLCGSRTGAQDLRFPKGSLELMIISARGKNGRARRSEARLHSAPARNGILVTNRNDGNEPRKWPLYSKGEAVEYTRFGSMLHEVDIVIASSAIRHPLHHHARRHAACVIAARRNEPIYLIDIAVPRNIDPTVNEIEGVFRKDVDDLEGVVNANLQERSKQAEQAEAIVLDEVERLISQLKLEVVTPTIISLQEQFESIRLAEVARALRRMPSLTAEQQRQVAAQMEAMTKSIVNKIAHLPISALRHNAGQPDGDQFLHAVRKVFHLQD